MHVVKPFVFQESRKWACSRTTRLLRKSVGVGRSFNTVDVVFYTFYNIIDAGRRFCTS